ncbi:uncharacterized protein L3040_007419 [Drepanopeziza brunnea f. sp. 'multigermtubi']|uniref:uncharacterized protein n=1 Tax=Drepanopeziza brunnea f. sp. 'multigermtubi' TaxID=698441 RepID=UPI0023A094E3|nr:hypothetical protein L3040_007419 [Drepanopeziza brunnea f. sp. 'multigermtubi']
MSNEIVQQTEQNLDRSTSTEGVTNSPHLPSSSTQATSTAQYMVTNKESAETALSGSQQEKDSLKVEDEALEAFTKDRKLLNVPSRSSSHKIQSSPTSTGLSGATASDSRNSIGGRSKESSGSILRRGRNGSATSSSKMSITPQGASALPGVTTEITSSKPASSRQLKKKKGFLSFLCCGVQGHANGPDANDAAVLANKVTKVPSRRTTTASRPEQVTPAPSNNNPNNSQIEKDALRQDAQKETDLEKEHEKERNKATTSNPGLNSPTGDDMPQGANSDGNQTDVIARDAPSAELLKRSESISAGQSVVPIPAVEVQGPSRSESKGSRTPEPAQEQTDEEGDIKMSDPEPIPADREEIPIPDIKTDETATKIALPLPPPAPQPQTVPTDNPSGAESIEEKSQWLLPPITPRFQGKKCLVLDLDETLVHSSFKILHQADFTIPVEIEGQYHNVYVIKRPGVDQFMKRVGELYEVVVFTASVSKYGDPLLDQLDIHKVVHHRLFRESCYNHQGNYVKDLSQVGRDLRETIIIDNSPTSYIFHPQHAVPISSWFSDAHDNELLDLIPVLEDLAGSQVRDVSLVLDVAL